MASEKLQKILAMSKNIDKVSRKTNQAPQRTLKREVSLQEQINNADKTIKNIDALYNSPYIPTKEEKEAWNTERGRNELTEMSDSNVFMKKLSQSRLPAAIVESMRQNPCNYDPTVVNKLMGPENELFKKLNEAYGQENDEPVRGVQAIHQINEQLEQRDKKENQDSAISENKTSNGNIDISALEEMIERVIDRKLNALNESKAPSIKSMSLTENGNFRFLDGDDNVYECQMKYLGKRKKKTTN